jgi:hypothetical protein
LPKLTSCAHGGVWAFVRPLVVYVRAFLLRSLRKPRLRRFYQLVCQSFFDNFPRSGLLSSALFDNFPRSGLLERVSELPRRQQAKIIELVEALVDQHRRKAS